MDKEQLAHEYALKALADQIRELEKAFLQGYDEAVRIMKPEEIDGVTYYDFGLPSGTLWSMPLRNEYGEEVYKMFTYKEASLYELPTYEQFRELIAACQIDGQNHLTPNGISFVGGYKEWSFWLKSEVENYTAYSIDNEGNKNPTHIGEKRRIMLVKNKFSL